MKTGIAILAFLITQTLYSFAFGQAGYSIEMIGEKFGKEYGNLIPFAHNRNYVYLRPNDAGMISVITVDKKTLEVSPKSPKEPNGMIDRYSSQRAHLVGGRIIVRRSQSPKHLDSLFSYSPEASKALDEVAIEEAAIVIFPPDNSSYFIVKPQQNATTPTLEVLKYNKTLDETDRYSISNFPKIETKINGHHLIRIDDQDNLYLDYYEFASNKTNKYTAPYNLLVRRFTSQNEVTDYFLPFEKTTLGPIMLKQFKNDIVGLFTYFPDQSRTMTAGFAMATYEKNTGKQIAQYILLFKDEADRHSIRKEFGTGSIAFVDWTETEEGYILLGLQQSYKFSDLKCNRIHACYFDKSLNRKWQRVIPIPEDPGSSIIYYGPEQKDFGYLEESDGVVLLFEDYQADRLSPYLPSKNGKMSVTKSKFAEQATLAWVKLKYDGSVLYGRVKNAEHPDFALLHNATHQLEDGTWLTMVMYLDRNYQFAKISPTN